MDDVVRVFRYYAGLADKDAGRLVATGSRDAISRIVYEPIGVCALIAPWNYPLLQASWKVAPALAAGEHVILKPAQVTPLTAIHLVRKLAEAGRPPAASRTSSSGPAAGSARRWPRARTSRWSRSPAG